MNGRDADTRVLVALARVEKLSPRRRELLLEQATLPSGLLSAEMKPALSAALGDALTDFYRFVDEADPFFDGASEKGIGWVNRLDDEYSDLLRETDGCPPVLFTKGNAGLLNSFALAIVGTRRPTRYGAKIADEFAREFAAAGVTVVSGFARGIDTAAHRAAVESGAPTIAVFGCGVDVCYPAENRELYDAVLREGGLFVSEYPPGTHPMPFRSLSPEDVLDHYRIDAPSSGDGAEAVQFDMTETLVLGCLHEGEKHFEELLAETGLSASELSTVLVNLELAGALEQTGGNHYALC